jgi:hypothetical protein
VLQPPARTPQQTLSGVPSTTRHLIKPLPHPPYSPTTTTQYPHPHLKHQAHWEGRRTRRPLMHLPHHPHPRPHSMWGSSPLHPIRRELRRCTLHSTGGVRGGTQWWNRAGEWRCGQIGCPSSLYRCWGLLGFTWTTWGPRKAGSAPLDDAGWDSAVPMIHPRIVVPQQPEIELGLLEIRWGPREMKSAPLEGASSTEA